MAVRGHHGVRVHLSSPCARDGQGLVKGQRYPITHQGLETPGGGCAPTPASGLSLPRLPARFRHQASAPDRQSQARVAGAQPRRPQDDGALRACVGRRRGRGDAALPRAKLRRAPHNFAHNKRAGSAQAFETKRLIGLRPLAWGTRGRGFESRLYRPLFQYVTGTTLPECRFLEAYRKQGSFQQRSELDVSQISTVAQRARSVRIYGAQREI